MKRPQLNKDTDPPLGPSAKAQAIKLIEEFEKRLRIDKYDLDNELVDFPDLFHQVARESALANSRRDEAALELKEVEARVDRDIREEARTEDRRITDTAVKQEIVLHRDYRDALHDHSEAVYISNRWAALKESMQQRSYALGHLVDLYEVGYFSDRSGGYAQKQAKERVYDQTREALADARRHADEKEPERPLRGRANPR